MDLVERVYSATESFPQKECYGLTNQMRRAAVSVPSNIAEGQGRGTTRDFVHFLGITRGSLQELHTQTLVAQRLRYLTDSQVAELVELNQEVQRILNGLVSSLTRPDH